MQFMTNFFDLPPPYMHICVHLVEPSRVYYHLYTVQYKISFQIKYTLMFFIFRFDLNVKHCSIFSNKNHGLQKEHFIEKIWKSYSITCFTHMTSHAIWEDEITSVLISIKTRFGILELGIRVAKSSYAKWRHTSNY